jgi:phytoene dehydrogenase-like protein
MAKIPPMLFCWDGEAMIPVNPGFADRHFVIGGKYRLSERVERSGESHGHYFAVLDRAWQSLSEELTAELPSPEHLRMRALIMTGYADTRQLVLSSNADALRTAAFIRPASEYSMISVNGAVITELSPQSQRKAAMDKEAFQKSKRDVIEYCAALIGVTVAELESSALRDAA